MSSNFYLMPADFIIFYGAACWINVWLVGIDCNPSRRNYCLIFKELCENGKVISGK